MGSRTCGWSVYDGVKRPLPTSPESLMAAIDAAIAVAEHAHATVLHSSRSPPSTAAHDALAADEAYKAARAALAAGRPDAAVRSLLVAIACCPPDRASALAKLRSLLAIASAHQKEQQRSSI